MEVAEAQYKVESHPWRAGCLERGQSGVRREAL